MNIHVVHLVLRLVIQLIREHCNDLSELFHLLLVLLLVVWDLCVSLVFFEGHVHYLLFQLLDGRISQLQLLLDNLELHLTVLIELLQLVECVFLRPELLLHLLVQADYLRLLVLYARNRLQLVCDVRFHRLLLNHEFSVLALQVQIGVSAFTQLFLQRRYQ